jgi:hypothetical protein
MLTRNDNLNGEHRVRDRMIFGFTTTSAISVYQH